MLEKIKEKITSIEQYLIDVRRYLHQHPELSGKEVNTANYIYKNLTDAGIDTEIIKTDTGPAVVAYLRTTNSNDFIAFRADTDALPINDKKNKPYKSQCPGIMHACGHDFHTTSVLGTALVLAAFKNDLKQNIKFIFQPAEEIPQSGASSLVKKGIIDDIRAIWTIHSYPSLKAGEISINSGYINASIDTFKIEVIGKGGHSSTPHLTKDPIFISNQILTCLYSEIPRYVDPLTPTVVSIGKFKAGTAPNVIPESAFMEGNLRTFDENNRQKIKSLIGKKMQNIANSFDVQINIIWYSSQNAVFNNDFLADITLNSAHSFMEAEQIHTKIPPSMGAEDFSRYLDYSAGMLIRIGTGGKNCSYPLHSCRFDINEDAIKTAVTLLSFIPFELQNKLKNLKILEESSYLP